MQDDDESDEDPSENKSRQQLFGWDINPNLELKTTEAGLEDVGKILSCISSIHFNVLETPTTSLDIENWWVFDSVFFRLCIVLSPMQIITSDHTPPNCTLIDSTWFKIVIRFVRIDEFSCNTILSLLAQFQCVSKCILDRRIQKILRDSRLFHKVFCKIA